MLLHCKHIRNASTMHVVGGSFFDRLLRREVTSVIPLTLSMLGNILTTSRLARMQFVGSCPSLLMLSIMSSMCDESLMRDGNSAAIGDRCFSTNIERNSTAVPHPLDIVRAGLVLLGLCVLMSPYIVPDLGFNGIV